jgi:putative FmdB family regulatory protein
VPIYEYACSRCGREFETLVRSDSVPQCPACGSQELAKKLSVFATANSTSHAQSAQPACMSCPHAGSRGACGLD